MYVYCCFFFFFVFVFFFFFKQKTAYEMCGRDWSSDVCSSDLNEYHCKRFCALFEYLHSTTIAKLKCTFIPTGSHRFSCLTQSQLAVNYGSSVSLHIVSYQSVRLYTVLWQVYIPSVGDNEVMAVIPSP